MRRMIYSIDHSPHNKYHAFAVVGLQALELNLYEPPFHLLALLLALYTMIDRWPEAINKLRVNQSLKINSTSRTFHNLTMSKHLQYIKKTQRLLTQAAVVYGLFEVACLYQVNLGVKVFSGTVNRSIQDFSV